MTDIDSGIVTKSFSSVGLSMLSILCHGALRSGMSEHVKEQIGAAVGLCPASSIGPNVSVSGANIHMYYVHTYVCSSSWPPCVRWVGRMVYWVCGG